MNLSRYSPATQEAVDLLSELIRTPSRSKAEHQAADLMQTYLEEKGIEVHRQGNNVWAHAPEANPTKPTLLLNSHLDTVKPSEGWSMDPFEPKMVGGKLYGLGSNDAGGALVCLAQTFLHFYAQGDLLYQLIFAATAEEEISGANGIASILPQLGKIDLAVVGEPTAMQMAVAEKGLVVLDCEVKGKSGHAARSEGENAIYKALQAIEKLRTFRFEKQSEYLGPILKTTTLISAGTQHNVVPDTCRFVVDVRTTDAYSNAETVEILKRVTGAQMTPRSLRLSPSSLSLRHPVVQRGQQLGLRAYGSPTLSDQALMNCDSLKIGPGDSARSHTANEYILLEELAQGMDTYRQLLNELRLH